MPQVSRTCEICTTAFQIHSSDLKYGRGRFCSKDCQKAWQTIPLAARFLKYASTSVEPSGCILWTGATNADGYGITGAGTQAGGNLLAHRVAYEQAHGPIPLNLKILHHCDNPPCINDYHLFPGTPADNIADMIAKGRGRKRTVGSRRWLQDQRRTACL